MEPGGASRLPPLVLMLGKRVPPHESLVILWSFVNFPKTLFFPQCRSIVFPCCPPSFFYYFFRRKWISSLRFFLRVGKGASTFFCFFCVPHGFGMGPFDPPPSYKKFVIERIVLHHTPPLTPLPFLRSPSFFPFRNGFSFFWENVFLPSFPPLFPPTPSFFGEKPPKFP